MSREKLAEVEAGLNELATNGEDWGGFQCARYAAGLVVILSGVRSDRKQSESSTLYNCCEGEREPNWFLFDAIEVHPCEDNGDYCEPCDDEEWLATMWTVYGHSIRGGIEALTDVSTFRLADEIAGKFRQKIERAQRVRTFYQAVAAFAQATKALDDCWAGLEMADGFSAGADDYPSGLPTFDEFAVEVMRWNETQQREARNAGVPE